MTGWNFFCMLNTDKGRVRLKKGCVLTAGMLRFQSVSKICLIKSVLIGSYFSAFCTFC